MKLLDTMLEQFKAQGLLKPRGKQRTDSTHVLAAIRTLNRLESAGETLRAALNAVATMAPEWLREQARNCFFSALELFVVAKDDFNRGIVLRSLARLWHDSGDGSIPMIIAPTLGSDATEAEELLRNMLEEQSDEPGS